MSFYASKKRATISTVSGFRATPYRLPLAVPDITLFALAKSYTVCYVPAPSLFIIERTSNFHSSYSVSLDAMMVAISC